MRRRQCSFHFGETVALVAIHHGVPVGHQAQGQGAALGVPKPGVPVRGCFGGGDGLEAGAVAESQTPLGHATVGGAVGPDGAVVPVLLGQPGQQVFAVQFDRELSEITDGGVPIVFVKRLSLRVIGRVRAS